MPQTRRPQNDGLQFRAFGIVPETLVEDQRTVDAVAATESPVLMPDWDRMEMVPEVLLISGMKFPANRTVPLLNSHNRHDAEDVIGSATELRHVDKELHTKTVFSSAAEGIYTRVKEGHLRDLSIGYKVEKKRFIPKDTTERVAGREFSGPVNVVTSCTIREVSVTPIGADAQAKMRGLQVNPFSAGATIMLTQEQRAKLVARGMNEDLDDQAAVAWAIDNPERAPADDKADESKRKADEEAAARAAATKPQLDVAEEVRKAILEAKLQVQKTFEEEAKAVRKLHDYIRAECKRYSLQEHVNDVIENCRTESEVGNKLLVLLHERQQKSPRTDSYIAFGSDAGEKLTEAMRTALCMKTLKNVKKAEVAEALFPAAQRSPHAADCRHWTMMKYAEMCCRQAGINTDVLSQEQIARGVLGDWQALGLRSPGTAYHHTGNFSKLTQDAFDISLRAGYMEYDATWQKVFPVGEPFANFNAKHIVQLGEFPNFEMWDGIKAPNEISVADAEEYWKPEAYANTISYGWKLLVNDNMDALSRTPMQFGNAAARTLNTHVWSIITANPTMQDGVALFATATGNRQKDNYTSSGTAISVASLGVAFKLMMLQVGLNTPENTASQAILAIRPKYIIVPATQFLTCMQIVKSISDPSASNDIKYNPWTYLEPVVEPLLDGNSTTAWYLAAGSEQINTIQVSFLNGYDTPQTRQWRDDKTLSLNFGVLQAYAAKAIDFRGLYKNAGA